VPVIIDVNFDKPFKYLLKSLEMWFDPVFLLTTVSNDFTL
jgi:hypothetical protein